MEKFEEQIVVDGGGLAVCGFKESFFFGKLQFQKQKISINYMGMLAKVR